MKKNELLPQNDEKRQIYTALALIGQLGAIMITSLLLCLGAAVWARHTWQLGAWVLGIGVVIGLLAGIYGVYRLLAKSFFKHDFTGGPK